MDFKEGEICRELTAKFQHTYVITNHWLIKYIGIPPRSSCQKLCNFNGGVIAVGKMYETILHLTNRWRVLEKVFLHLFHHLLLLERRIQHSQLFTHLFTLDFGIGPCLFVVATVECVDLGCSTCRYGTTVGNIWRYWTTARNTWRYRTNAGRICRYGATVDKTCRCGTTDLNACRLCSFMCM